MKQFLGALLAFCFLLGFGAACRADEASLGLYAHDIPFMGKRVHEGGEEVVAAWQGDKIARLKFLGSPTPYVIGGVNAQGKTDFVGAGLRWRVNLGKRLYVQVGNGIALNDAPTHAVPGRIDAGSHITFEPEGSVGWRLTKRVAVEVSYIHLSHAYLFSPRNPGLNELGMRMVVKFDRHTLLHPLGGGG